MLIATAGHVDHGKTLLIQTLTGVDTDRLPEEKARGLTIDLGFAYHDLAGQRVGFVDVPGHERFIHNMLAGVGAIDLALLVVAADDGVMPQTREHVAILELLGVQRAMVAVTKIDRTEPSRVAEVVDEVQALLADTPLRNAAAWPVSAMTGTGMDALRDALASSLGDKAKATDSREGGQTQGFRLAIDRSFSVQGAGLVVTGAVFDGEVAAGDMLTLSPDEQEVRVRSLHANGREAESARRGERAALNLVATGLRKEHLVRGSWLTTPGAGVVCERFDARLDVLATEIRPLRHWSPVHFHVGAWSDTGRIAVLGGRSIAPGESGYVQIVPDHPLHVLHGDRFVVRDQTARRTVAGGSVLDPFAEQRDRHKPSRQNLLDAHATRGASDSLAALSALPGAVVPLDTFALRRNLAAASGVPLAEALQLRIVTTPDGPAALSPDSFARFESALLEAMSSFHGAYPDRVGASDAELINLADLKTQSASARVALRELVREGLLHRDDNHVRRPGHKVLLTRAEQQLWERIAAHLTEDAAAPPVVAELADALGEDRKALDTFLRASAHRGMLVRVADNRYYHPAAVARHARVVRQLAGSAEKGRFSAADFRTAAGIGRNLAIDLLEHFDSQRLTRRLGNLRELRPDSAGR